MLNKEQLKLIETEHNNSIPYQIRYLEETEYWGEFSEGNYTFTTAFFQLKPKEQEYVILHEIAHSWVGGGHNDNSMRN